MKEVGECVDAIDQTGSATFVASTLRHLFQWVMGTEYDTESGLHHIAHARANLGMLLELIMRGRKELDNRPPAVPAGTVITTRYIA